jgi:hypothetical protein
MRRDRLQFYIVNGGCFLLAAGLFLLVVSPFFMQYHGMSPASVCWSNLQNLDSGLQMYVEDYDGRFPEADKWHDASLDYVKNEGRYVCPTRRKQGVGYAFNRVLSKEKMKRSKEPGKTPLLFESSLGQRNGTDTLQRFVTPHLRRGFISYLDGHVRSLTSAPSADAGLRKVSQ